MIIVSCAIHTKVIGETEQSTVLFLCCLCASLKYFTLAPVFPAAVAVCELCWWLWTWTLYIVTFSFLLRTTLPVGCWGPMLWPTSSASVETGCSGIRTSSCTWPKSWAIDYCLPLTPQVAFHTQRYGAHLPEMTFSQILILININFLFVELNKSFLVFSR